MTDREVMQMALDCLLAFEKEDYFRWSKEDNACVAALRTALAQHEKEWVGMTDEDINDHWITAMWNTKGTRLPIPEFARAIEAKLKEKNNG